MITATLTTEQETNWENADWGVNSRSDNRKVAQTVITMLAEGIENKLIWDDREHLMNIIAERSGVSEVIDTNGDCRDTVVWVLCSVCSDRVVWMEADIEEEV